MQLSSISLAITRLLPSAGGALPPATDPLFDYVCLLLNTSATNGAQNNTFLDSSTNNFSITRNGNTTQGNFSPFSQTGWSNFFDGNGDNLSIAHNAALNLSSGDFTLEAWVYWNGVNVNAVVMDKDGVAGLAYPQYQIALNGSGFLRFLFGGGPSVFQTLTSSTAMPKNVWVHVAGVKSGTNMSLYQDGVSVASATQTATITDNARALLIGYSTGQPADAYFDGYISNARIVKGTAVYTANFTPPTSPLTAITNTSLLTCQSNRFIDNSSNAFAITRNGDVSVQAFSPFNPTAAWSASTNGGSGYFDGTGDYLSIANNAAFQIGTGDFCMEGWFYTNSTSIQQLFGTAYTTGTNYILLQINRNSVGSNVVGFIQGGIDDTTGFVNSSSAVFNLSCWNHAVLCRTGTTLSLFVNGSRVATITSSTSSNSTQAFEIGQNTGFNRAFNGFITAVRLVKGSTPYDATSTTLTVPTAPLTAITNTSLLLNFTNAGIYDSASGNDLETVGNAQVSTTQAKWGTTSMAFDGTGDWLVVPASPRWDFGSGDFTVEMWLNPSSTTTTDAVISKGNVSSTGNEVWALQWFGTNQLAFFSGGGLVSPVVNTTTQFSTGTWYHVAVTRSGTTTRIFVNGTQEASSTTSYTVTAGGSLYVGAGWFAPASRDTSGYIDDLRITNGVARYTSNFTAPTAAFPLQ